MKFFVNLLKNLFKMNPLKSTNVDPPKIIKFIPPHSISMGENFYYISTFKKGKYNPTVENYRIIIRGVDTGVEMILALEARENFFGRPVSYMINIIKVSEYITPTHIKGENKRYNYYKYSDDPNTVADFFKLWISNDPMVSVGGHTHQFISSMKNYQGSYEFNAIKY